MTWVWRVATVGGAILALLGGLWFLQGIGLVTIDPILCAGDCEPVQAPSVRWTVTGTITALVGAALLIVGVPRSRRQRRLRRPRVQVTDRGE